MKNVRFIMCAVAVLILAVTVSYSAGSEANPALSKKRFDAIVKKLETGGDLLIVANMEGYLQGIITDISQMVMILPDEEEVEDINAFLKKLPAFLQKSGFYGVRGFGLSIVPQTNGLNRIRYFIDRDFAAARLPLWRGLFGIVPRPLKCMGFLPPDTVVARTGNGDFKQLWKLFRSGMAELASPEANEDFNDSLSDLATDRGVDLDKVINSLGSEGFFSIQLARSVTFEFPVQPDHEPLKIPQPSFLIGLAVKDDSILKAVEVAINGLQMPILKTRTNSVEISTVEMPMPTPFPVELSFTIYSNFFLLGSTRQVLTEAISAFQSKKGLVATPEFKQAFEGMPVTNNGIFYMSPRFMQTVRDLQMATLAGPVRADTSLAAMRRILGRHGKMQSAFVVRNYKNGVLMTGKSTLSGKDMVGSVALAPIGLLAGIAIPSFIRARTTSQQNACMNNLRIIEAGKDQYALEQGLTNGTAILFADIGPGATGGSYIKNWPVCPAGTNAAAPTRSLDMAESDYDINPIGSNAACRIIPPTHLLR